MQPLGTRPLCTPLERHGERDIQRYRLRQRQRKIETQRQTDKDTDQDRQTDRQTEVITQTSNTGVGLTDMVIPQRRQIQHVTRSYRHLQWTSVHVLRIPNRVWI